MIDLVDPSLKQHGLYETVFVGYLQIVFQVLRFRVLYFFVEIRGQKPGLIFKEENWEEIWGFIARQAKVWDFSGSFYKQLTQAKVRLEQTFYLNKWNNS